VLEAEAAGGKPFHDDFDTMEAAAAAAAKTSDSFLSVQGGGSHGIRGSGGHAVDSEAAGGAEKRQKL
jgi:hypothetical protein